MADVVQEVLRSRRAREELLSLLRQRGGGCLLRGWRQEIDPEGHLKAGYEAVSKAANRLGFSDDVHLLFDGDSSGCLALETIDAEAVLLVGRFQAWLEARFGGPMQMYRSLDLQGYGRLTQRSFARESVAQGFEGTEEELRELFDSCDLDAQGFIAQDDVIFLNRDLRARDHELFNLKMSRRGQRQHLLADMYVQEQSRAVPASHRLAIRPWHAETYERLPKVVLEKQRTRRRGAQKSVRSAFQAFLQHLRQTYGNEVRAWRRGLDPHGAFSLTLQSLRRFCTKTKAPVDISTLWRQLDRDSSGQCGMEELCPKASDVLASFQLWARQVFGSCAAFWDHPEGARARLAPQRGGTWAAGASKKKMLRSSFGDVLAILRWPAVNDKEAKSLLLSSLDLFGCGFVQRSDLEWLDKWRPPEWLCAEPDPGALEDLRNIVTRVFGHPLRAWRALFDRDDSNSVSWNEFFAACQELGFPGNVGGAWRALDTDLSGHITMREFDPGSAVLLTSFKQWADLNFGSVELAFKTIDADFNGTVTLAELKRACKRLHWGGDVRLLFNCLDTDVARDDVGKRSLSFQELSFLDSWDDPDDAQWAEVLESNSPRGGGASPDDANTSAAEAPQRSASLPSLAPAAAEAAASAASQEAPSATELEAALAELLAAPTCTATYARMLAEVGHGRSSSKESTSVARAPALESWKSACQGCY
eukprot:TRINITY_DN26803_c0_g1_i1.p1 TRINITY_DN26803_c0_g1~~TRINITY_DN26803_c0_g1_i1.p1  ORF type:complete len:737 (-),score=154.55 TRINITY_DN26803_c0_g1_i1:148-2256(-)